MFRRLNDRVENVTQVGFNEPIPAGRVVLFFCFFPELHLQELVAKGNVKYDNNKKKNHKMI